MAAPVIAAINDNWINSLGFSNILSSLAVPPCMPCGVGWAAPLLPYAYHYTQIALNNECIKL